MRGAAISVVVELELNDDDDNEFNDLISIVATLGSYPDEQW